MEKRLFTRNFGILVMTLAILAVYPWVQRAFPVLGLYFRTYDPFAKVWVRPDSESQEVLSAAESSPDTAAGFPFEVAHPDFVLPPEAFTDGHIRYTGHSHLQGFRDLLKAGREQVRIAYFGDSSIEGDLVAQTLRESLQQQFGGEGVGFLPLLPAVLNFRRTVHQSASDNWHHHRPRAEKQKGTPFGIAGDYFTAIIPSSNDQEDRAPDSISLLTSGGGEHWVNFNAGKTFPGTQRFPSVRVFYGRPNDMAYKGTQVLGRIHLHGQDIDLKAPSALNVVSLPVANATRLRLSFSVPDNLPLYGISMESPGGIIVDNFPMRGNSGAGLLQIPETQLSAFHALLDYDLILLQFGLNVLNPDLRDYRWYEEQMIQTIVHLKKSIPGAGIVVIGLSDKSIRVEGMMRSDPSVARITDAQRRAAFRCGVPFFSIFEAMGGEGSMVEWVEQRRFANRDYTHFNFEGAEKISDFLLQFLLGEDPALSKKI